MAESAYLTYSEAARQIDGVTRHDIANLVAQRKLRYVLMPGQKRRRVDLAELQRALADLKRIEEPAPCPSTKPRKARTTNTTSSATVFDFTARRAKLESATR